MSKNEPYRAKTKHYVHCAVCDHKSQYRNWKTHWGGGNNPHPQHVHLDEHDRYLQLKKPTKKYDPIEFNSDGKRSKTYNPIKDLSRYPAPPRPPTMSLAADSDHDSNDSQQEEQKGIVLGDTPNEPNTVCYVFVFLSIKWLIPDWSLFIVID